jgi:hypothetical protein
MNLTKALARWRSDPVTFAEELVNPDTGAPFTLYEEQRRFLREAVKRDADGRLLYPLLIYSTRKTSGNARTSTPITKNWLTLP